MYIACAKGGVKRQRGERVALHEAYAIYRVSIFFHSVT
ncbi:MAG: hypothetical protein ACI8XB_003016 [Patiriisocius sp.]|jgi:hypothetical protein